MSDRKDELRANLVALTDAQLARLHDVVVASFTGDYDAARAGFRDQNARIRAAATTSMSRLGILSQLHLNEALLDSAVEVRLAAVNATLPLGTFELKPLLALESDPLVLEAIIFAIGEKLEEDAYPDLCKIALDHADALCREAAVAAIANFQREDSLEVLTRASVDKAPIRRRVAIALAGLESARATELLKELSKDRDWQTRQIAEEILAIENGEPE